MKSLLLNQETWDLTIDGAKNIAFAKGSDAIAQNVATTISVFLGEQYFQSDMGIPYFNILGKSVALSYFTNLIEQEALKVEGVVSAKCVINNFNTRKLSGKLLFTDNLGNTNDINF